MRSVAGWAPCDGSTGLDKTKEKPSLDTMVTWDIIRAGPGWVKPDQNRTIKPTDSGQVASNGKCITWLHPTSNPVATNRVNQLFCPVESHTIEPVNPQHHQSFMSLALC